MDDFIIRPDTFSFFSWREKTEWAESKLIGRTDPRDQLLVYLNDDPVDIRKMVEENNFLHRYFSTYTFCSHPRQSDGELMTVERIENLMMRFYRDQAKALQSEVYPFLFISPSTKSLHFHAIECYTKPIENLQLQVFIQSSWGKLFREHWVWNGTIRSRSFSGRTQHEAYDSERGAALYSGAKHIQVIAKKPFVPKTIQKKGTPTPLFNPDTISRLNHTRVVQTLQHQI